MSRLLLGCVAALAVACGGPPTLPALAPPPVDVQMRVQAAKVASGESLTVEVEVWQTEGWTLEVPPPMSEGLTVAPIGVDGPSVVARRSRVTATFELSGEDGSYVVGLPPIEATGPGDQSRTLEPAPLFVDIGVPGPQLGPLAELEELPPEEPPNPLHVVAAAAGGLALLGLLGALVWWRMRPAAPPPPVPADVAARAAWTRARESGIDDHALALALSEILRTFLQEVTGFPAMSRTSMEILAWASSSLQLESSLRARAQRVLEATDRLKFAREGGGEDFFEELEADFLAVVAALAGSGADPDGEATNA